MNGSMKKYIIITAGGSGSRMGGPVAKQFMEINGKAILHMTFEIFSKAIPDAEIIMVLPASGREIWKEYCLKHFITKKHTLVEGGLTRFHSVQNALNTIKGSGIVAIHDGVRPFVPPLMIRSMFEQATALDVASGTVGVIPVMPAVESMRVVCHESCMTRAVDRKEYMFVQTPQLFDLSSLKKAYSQPYNQLFTDDASVVESAGMHVTTSPGSRYNIKITTPEDMEIGQLFAMLSL